MLTVKQPPTYGYKSVHDLPTPPSTSRPSPPLSYQETSQKTLPAIPRSHSPTYQPMSAPHRGLPPPAAMTLPPQQPPPSNPPSHHSQPPPPPPPAPPSIGQAHHQGSQHSQPWTTLPAPPQQWQGAEDSMRNWLQAKAEEEKTKQEEEKTRQESLRLEQRKIEMDMLRASLGGGIPPPMVPLVFAGMSMGGVLPQAALEWAQQYMQSSQAHHPQHPALQGPHSPDHPREGPSSSHGHYAGSSSGPASRDAGAYANYPGSPTRSRTQTLPGTMTRSVGGTPSLPSLGNVPPPPGQAGGGVLPPHQAHSQVQASSAQQEASPSIYFHHWQPPTSQPGPSSNRPGSPSGETPRKRKATGPQQAATAPSEQFRFRSPPPSHAHVGGQSPGRKGSHKRQRSDVSWYQASGQRPAEGRDHQGGVVSPSYSRERDKTESRKHSVSSLLSGDPGETGVASQQASQTQQQQQQQQHHAQPVTWASSGQQSTASDRAEQPPPPPPPPQQQQQPNQHQHQR